MSGFELENVEIVCDHYGNDYSYVIPGNEYQEAFKILRAAIGPVISGDDSSLPLTHKMGFDDDGNRALVSVK